MDRFDPGAVGRSADPGRRGRLDGQGVPGARRRSAAPGCSHRRDARLLHECFERDEVEANGQRFLFRPRPARPPIIVGGAPPHAIRRAVRFGDGWMPTAMHADVLESGIADLRAGMAAAGKPAPEVVLLQPLPVDDDERLASRLGELAALGRERGSSIRGATRMPRRSPASPGASSPPAMPTRDPIDDGAEPNAPGTEGGRRIRPRRSAGSAGPPEY